MVKGDFNKKEKKKQCATQFVKKDMSERRNSEINAFHRDPEAAKQSYVRSDFSVYQGIIPPASGCSPSPPQRGGNLAAPCPTVHCHGSVFLWH